jgi:Fe-S-cluster-containing dehydrogenase component
VACKQWNDLPAEKTKFFGCEPSGTPLYPSVYPQANLGPAPPKPTQVSGYQNPVDLSFVTYTLLRFFGDQDVRADRCIGLGPGCVSDISDYLNKTGNWNGQWNFMKWGCFHCLEPRCVEYCEQTGASGVSGYDSQWTSAMRQDPTTGFVWVDDTICTGCMHCGAGIGPNGCYWNIPRQGHAAAQSGPLASKCHGCIHPAKKRVGDTYDATATGNTDQYQAGDNDIASKSLLQLVGNPSGPSAGASLLPACVTACPNGALQFGDHDDVITAANARAVDPQVLADYPCGVHVFGLGNYGEPETRFIMVLTEVPDWYQAVGMADMIPSP